jgi:hypothetical protein
MRRNENYVLDQGKYWKLVSEVVEKIAAACLRRTDLEKIAA